MMTTIRLSGAQVTQLVELLRCCRRRRLYQ